MIRLIAALDSPSPTRLQDLGGAWDSVVFEELCGFAAAGAQKGAVRERMDRARSWAIVSWAEAMASLAVREGSRQRLVMGLVGLSLFDTTEFDAREAANVYRLFVRAADLLEFDADQVTRAAAELTDTQGRRWLLDRLPVKVRSVPRTHIEVGTGPNFAFQRHQDEWDPETELSEYLGD